MSERGVNLFLAEELARGVLGKGKRDHAKIPPWVENIAVYDAAGTLLYKRQKRQCKDRSKPGQYDDHDR